MPPAAHSGYTPWLGSALTADLKINFKTCNGGRIKELAQGLEDFLAGCGFPEITPHVIRRVAAGEVISTRLTSWRRTILWSGVPPQTTGAPPSAPPGDGDSTASAANTDPSRDRRERCERIERAHDVLSRRRWRCLRHSRRHGANRRKIEGWRGR